MALLTIGTFAKASRLTPKALRLYDELGLLTPARVDPVTGYRLYAPEQLEQARLVAWLRRLGMPLARIQHVSTLEPAAAAREIRAFWAQAEAETAARRSLASFLISHLSGKDPAMSSPTTPLEIRYAASSRTGFRRRPPQRPGGGGGKRRAGAEQPCRDALFLRGGPGRPSPRCSGPAPSWHSSTSATHEPNSCATGSCSRSRTTTPWCSPWSTRDGSHRRKRSPALSVRCSSERWARRGDGTASRRAGSARARRQSAVGMASRRAWSRSFASRSSSLPGPSPKRGASAVRSVWVNAP